MANTKKNKKSKRKNSRHKAKKQSGSDDTESVMSVDVEEHPKKKTKRGKLKVKMKAKKQLKLKLKLKRKLKKKHSQKKKKLMVSKPSTPSGEEFSDISDASFASDLDDKNSSSHGLCSLGNYIHDRKKLVFEAFQAISPRVLKGMIPPELKDLDRKELVSRCAEAAVDLSVQDIVNLFEGKKNIPKQQPQYAKRGRKDSSPRTPDSDHKPVAVSQKTVPRMSDVESSEEDCDMIDLEIKETEMKEILVDRSTSKQKKSLHMENEEELNIEADINIHASDLAPSENSTETAQPSVSGVRGKTLMEILELELRAKVIRQMLKSEHLFEKDGDLNQRKDVGVNDNTEEKTHPVSEGESEFHNNDLNKKEIHVNDATEEKTHPVSEGESEFHNSDLNKKEIDVNDATEEKTHPVSEGESEFHNGDLNKKEIDVNDDTEEKTHPVNEDESEFHRCETIEGNNSEQITLKNNIEPTPCEELEATAGKSESTVLDIASINEAEMESNIDQMDVVTIENNSPAESKDCDINRPGSDEDQCSKEDDMETKSYYLGCICNPDEQDEETLICDLESDESLQQTWKDRWLSSRKVQKVVADSKFVGKLKQVLKRKNRERHASTEKSVDGEEPSQMPMIGSIEEYQKVVGIKIPDPVEAQSVVSDESSDEDLWRKIIG